MDGHALLEVRIREGEAVVVCECGWKSEPVADADEGHAHIEHAEHAEASG